jgi:hypothetical protein
MQTTSPRKQRKRKVKIQGTDSLSEPAPLGKTTHSAGCCTPASVLCQSSAGSEIQSGLERLPQETAHAKNTSACFLDTSRTEE